MPVAVLKSVSVRLQRSLLTVLLSGAALALTACGQKGPLTLPAAAGAASAASAPAR